MRIEDRSFDITLGESIHLTITPMYVNDKDLSYQISIGGKVHGHLIPDLDDDLGLIWRTNDNIDPRLVNVIGKLIDGYKA